MFFTDEEIEQEEAKKGPLSFETLYIALAAWAGVIALSAALWFMCS